MTDLQAAHDTLAKFRSASAEVVQVLSDLLTHVDGVVRSKQSADQALGIEQTRSGMLAADLGRAKRDVEVLEAARMVQEARITQMQNDVDALHVALAEAEAHHAEIHAAITELAPATSSVAELVGVNNTNVAFDAETAFEIGEPEVVVPYSDKKRRRGG